MSSYTRPQHPSLSRVAIFSMVVGGASLLCGCGGISATTKERIAQTQTAVQQAQSTLGTSESGALELQHARESLDAARRAADDGKEEQALRSANDAQLQAELAVAKSQSAAARKAAEEMLASIQTLRDEAQRGQQPVTR